MLLLLLLGVVFGSFSDVPEKFGDVWRKQPLLSAPMAALREVENSAHLFDAANCRSAWNDLSTQLRSAECVDVFEIFKNFTTLSSSELETMATGYCTACSHNVTMLWSNFRTQCAGVRINGTFLGVVDDDHVRQIYALSMIPCITMGTHYCIVDAQALALTDPKTTTQTSLASVCTPCAGKVFLTLAEIGDAQDAAKAALAFIMCDQRGGMYCLPIVNALLANASSFIAGAAQSIPTDTQIQDVCNPCVRSFVRRSLRINYFLIEIAAPSMNLALTARLQIFNDFLRVLCQRDPVASEYCIQRVSRVNQQTPIRASLSQCGSASAPNPTAPACVTAVGQLVKNLGCCMGAFLRYVAIMHSMNSTNPSQLQIVLLLEAESVPHATLLPYSTCAQKALSLWVVLRNARWDAYQAAAMVPNSAIIARLNQSLAYYLEADPLQLQIDWETAITNDGAGNAKVFFNLTLDDDNDAATIISFITSPAFANSTTLPDINQNPLSTQIDGTEPVSVDAQEVSAESVTSCDASTGYVEVNGQCENPSNPSGSNQLSFSVITLAFLFAATLFH